MSECGTVRLLVPIQAARSHTGEARLDYAEVDACIAPAVRALLDAGIETAGSCCGHGRQTPSVMLADGTSVWWGRDGLPWLQCPVTGNSPFFKSSLEDIRPQGKLAEVMAKVGPLYCAKAKKVLVST